jgi:hypothetical protein
MINLSKVLRYGLIWGAVALGLALLELLLGGLLRPLFDALNIVGLKLPWFAVIMAGVHYGARNDPRSWLTSIIGGGLTALLAAILLAIVSALFAGRGYANAGLFTLAAGFVVGLLGGLGGEIVSRGQS